jgi:cyclopropane fatty-acyl-phospholipid synthase-like methyltransferase
LPAFDDAQAFWDQRFAEAGYIFGTLPNVFLKSRDVLFTPGMRVLDVACGEGRNSVWLATQGCAVEGFDISPLALAKARRLADERHVSVRFVQADIREWPWAPDQVDAIVCIFIQFASPEDRARLFEGFRTTLKPGGTVLLQGYAPRQLDFGTGGPRDPAHLYTPELLQEAFAGFDILHLEEHEEVLAEGTKHVGRSALVDLVARKRS